MSDNSKILDPNSIIYINIYKCPHFSNICAWWLFDNFCNFCYLRVTTIIIASIFNHNDIIMTSMRFFFRDLSFSQFDAGKNAVNVLEMFKHILLNSWQNFFIIVSCLQFIDLNIIKICFFIFIISFKNLAHYLSKLIN